MPPSLVPLFTASGTTESGGGEKNGIKANFVLGDNDTVVSGMPAYMQMRSDVSIRSSRARISY